MLDEKNGSRSDETSERNAGGKLKWKQVAKTKQENTGTERGYRDNGEQKGKWKKKGSPSTREERQDLGEKEPSTERGDRNNREQKGKDTTGKLGGREEQQDLGEEQKSSVEDDGKSSSTVEKQQKIVKQKIIAALEAWGRSAGQMSAPTPGARTLKSRRAS